MKKIITLILIMVAFAMAQQSFKTAIDTLGRCWYVNSSENTVVFKCDHGRFVVFTDTMSIMMHVDSERLMPGEKGCIAYITSFGKGKGKKKTTRVVVYDEFNVIVAGIDLKFINPYDIYEYFKKTTLNKPRKKEPLSDVGRVYTTYKPKPTPEDIKIAKIMEKYK